MQWNFDNSNQSEEIHQGLAALQTSDFEVPEWHPDTGANVSLALKEVARGWQDIGAFINLGAF